MTYVLSAILPGRGEVVWRDWYTHEIANPNHSQSVPVELHAPLGHIPVHIRGGAAILLHEKPGYTTAESRSGPFELLVSLDASDMASGYAYLDDGISLPGHTGVITNRTLSFAVRDKTLTIQSRGEYLVPEYLSRVIIIGPTSMDHVQISGQLHPFFSYETRIGRLNISGLELSLNSDVTLSWA